MLNSRKNNKSKARNSDVGPSGPSREPWNYGGNSNSGRVFTDKNCGPKTCASTANTENVDAKPKCVPPPKVNPPCMNSLGSAVGMVKTSYGMSTADQEIGVLQPQRFATLLKTMATIYIMPVCQWQSETVDAIMQEGEVLYIESRNASVDEPNKISDIYNEHEVNILREFSYEDVSFHIELTKQIALEGDDKNKNPDLKPKLSDLYKILKMFFISDDLYGVILLDDWYLMIWRHQSIYFVADYYGRRISDFKSDRENGFAMVISLRDIENVMHLILNLSNLTEETTYSFRPMLMAKLITPDGRVQTREYELRKNEFCAVNANYAYLAASLHLCPHGNSGNLNQASLPAAIAVIIAAKIDKPGTWTSRQLHHLMCYGLAFRKFSWNPPVPHDDPKLIESFPTKLQLGQFNVEIAIQSTIVRGNFLCVPAALHSHLSTSINQFFEHGDFKLILQINYQIYSIWFNHGYIYFFDPYPHHLYGSAKNKHLLKKYASLRIFRSMKYFLTVLNMVLCEYGQNAKFYLHAVKIKSISSLDNKIVAQRCEETDDTISLNENICFDFDESHCEDQEDACDMSESSDSGPGSDLPSSSTCASYEGFEQEEHEGGLRGDYSGVESSSSHETVKKKRKLDSSDDNLKDQSSKITVTISNKDEGGDNAKKMKKKRIRYPVSPQGVVGEPIEKSSRNSLDSQIGKSKKNKKKKNKSKGKQSSDDRTSLIDEPEIIKEADNKKLTGKGAIRGSTDDSDMQQKSDKSRKKGKKSKKQELPKDDGKGEKKVEIDTKTEFEPVKEEEPAKVDKIQESAKKDKEQQDDKNKMERGSSASRDDIPKKGAKKKVKDGKKKAADNTPEWFNKKLNDSSTDLDGEKKSDLLNSLEPSVSNIFKTSDDEIDRNVFKKKKDDRDKDKEQLNIKPDKSKLMDNNKKKQKTDKDKEKREKTDKDKDKEQREKSYQGKEQLEKSEQDKDKEKREKADQDKDREQREKTDKDKDKEQRENSFQGKDKDKEKRGKSDQDKDKEKRGKTDQDKDREQREKAYQDKEKREKADQDKEKRGKTDQDKDREQREKAYQDKEKREKADQDKDKEKLEKTDQDKDKEKQGKIYQDGDKEQREKTYQDNEKRGKTVKDKKKLENNNNNKDKEQRGETDKNKNKDKFDNLTSEEPRGKNKDQDKFENLTQEEATNIDTENRKKKITTEKNVTNEKPNKLKTSQAERKLERKNGDSTEQDGGNKSELEFIDMDQIDIEDLKKQHRIEKQKRRELIQDGDNAKNTPENQVKTTDLYNAEERSSEQNFRGSYGELFKKRKSKSNLPTIWEESETQEQQDATTEEEPEKAKPKKKKNKKKRKKAKKEQEVFCNLEPESSEIKLEYEERQKKLQTVEEICKYYIDKLEGELKERGVEIPGAAAPKHICCVHHCTDSHEPYPGVSKEPTELVLIKTRSQSHGRLVQLFRTSFQFSDRVLIQTPWDNFMVFRYCDSKERAYYLYAGCFCNLNRFRFMDLRTGKQGLTRLPNLNAVVMFIKECRKSLEMRRESKQTHEEKINEILAEYTNK